MSDGEGRTARFRVALTFDAEHPDRPRCRPGVHDQMVKMLDELSVRATFFLQGRWVEAYPEAARRVVDAGHLIGNHSFYHARMPLLSPDGFREDVREAERAIRDIAGADPRPWFRSPFGAGSDDPTILAALDGLGYREVGWHVEPREWRIECSGSWVSAFVLDETVRHGDDTVVLLHTWPEPAAEALPTLVAGLRARGAEFVTVADLDALPAPVAAQEEGGS